MFTYGCPLLLKSKNQFEKYNSQFKLLHGFKVVNEWLIKADEDFEFAASIIEDSTYYAQICFHFHQAAEKYFKSFIIAWDLEFKKIHDLPVLLKSCLSKEPNLNAVMNDCKFLNRFYIDTRYPVHWPTQYTKEEALKAKIAAKNIREIIKKNL
ncbi:MAG: HEPN domain-containing protein [Proteobacteria bacterium]|nr:HEPN domain-containing protein [Pseudomonadota bacterium]